MNAKPTPEGEEETGLLSSEVPREEYKESPKVDATPALDISTPGVDSFLSIIGPRGSVHRETEAIGFNCDSYLGYPGGVAVNFANASRGTTSKATDVDGCTITLGPHDDAEEAF